MDLFSKIGLSWRYGKMIYLISAILSVTMAVLVLFRPLAIPFCIIIKLLSIPVIFYLNFSLTKGLGIYFYINLGISRKEYHLIPLVVDVLLFVLLLIVSALTGYAIR